MKTEKTVDSLLQQVEELRIRLEEAEQMIEAIKAGEVDAFALRKDDHSEVFTLQSGDFAYRVLVENFGEGALNLSEDGLIVYTNSYFHDLLGLSYDNVIGHSIYEFIHEDFIGRFSEFFKKGIAGKSKGEITLSFGKKNIPVYISMTSLYPTLHTIGMIVTDLSEKKQFERHLEEANKRLADKIEELAKSNTELASFNYIASHDLQEPLRKIQTFSLLIMEREFQNLSESGQAMFLRMQVAAKRMQSLIVDLLGYARVHNKDDNRETQSFELIMDELTEDMSEEIKERNATIEVDPMCDVYVHPSQFRQLLQNLLSNSLKFTQPDKDPLIKISAKKGPGYKFPLQGLEPKQTYCHIRVTDNGIGFEPQYSEKIFELFQRLHGKEEYMGTGIGLTIVKRIVENHDGIIIANGNTNEGATFDIYLPQ